MFPRKSFKLMNLVEKILSGIYVKKKNTLDLFEWFLTQILYLKLRTFEQWNFVVFVLLKL